MKIIRDYFRRNRIKSFAKKIVNDHITASELRKLSEGEEKKESQKIKKLTSRIKNDANNYITSNKLGVYGKSKLLLEIQAELEDFDFPPEVISYMINRLLR